MEGKTDFDNIHKSYWSLIVESILDYYRIVYDIYMTEQHVALLVNTSNLTSDENGQIHTIFTWNNNYCDNLMEGLAKLNIRLFKAANTHYDSKNSNSNIDKAIEHLTLDVPANTFESFIGRIIIFTHLETEQDIEDTFEYIKKQYNIIVSSQRLISMAKLEMVIINVNKANNLVTPSISFQKLHNDPSIVFEYYNATPGKNLTELMIYLVQKHYGLSSTTVTGIPMKEEQNASACSSNYDVEILHSSQAYVPKSVSRPKRLREGTNKGGNQLPKLYNYPATLKTRNSVFDMYQTVLLQWCTPPKNATHSTEYYQQNCRGAYPISPVMPHSRPSSCLTNFLLSNRIVLLERLTSTPQPLHQTKLVASPQPQTFASAYSQTLARETGTSPAAQTKLMTSHMLANFGNCIYIMNLTTHRPIFDDPPSISEGPGGRVTDYRIPDLSKLIKQCLLTNGIPVDGGVKRAKDFLQQLTIYWPIVYGESLILSIPLLSSFIEKLVNSAILRDKSERLKAKHECVEVLEAFHEMEQQNQALPGPAALSGSLRSSAGLAARKEVYKNVWLELEKVVTLIFEQMGGGGSEISEVRQQLISLGKATPIANQTDSELGSGTKGENGVEVKVEESTRTLSPDTNLMEWADDSEQEATDESSFKMGNTKQFGLVWKDILSTSQRDNTHVRPQLEGRMDAKDSKVELYPFLKERYAKLERSFGILD